jgi:hypothetical protein
MSNMLVNRESPMMAALVFILVAAIPLPQR